MINDTSFLMVDNKEFNQTSKNRKFLEAVKRAFPKGLTQNKIVNFK